LRSLRWLKRDVEKYVCAPAEVLNDDGDEADTPAPLEAESAADDALADNSVGVVQVEDVATVDNVMVAPAAPSLEFGKALELGKAQMNRLHERGWAWMGERFLEPVEFPGQMELRQLEGFPGPLGPALREAFVLALSAFQARANLKIRFHSHQY